MAVDMPFLLSGVELSATKHEEISDESADAREATQSPNESSSDTLNTITRSNTALPVASQVEPPPEVLERLRKLEEQQNAVLFATLVEDNVETSRVQKQ